MEQRRGGKERRGSDRLSLAVPVFTRGVDEQGKEFLEFTTTLNISGGGALLPMRRYLPPDSPVTLEVPVAPLPRLSSRPKLVRKIQAHVVRVTVSEPSYLWALAFDFPVN